MKDSLQFESCMINHPKYNWYEYHCQKISIYFLGGCWIDNQFYNHSDLGKALIEYFDLHEGEMQYSDIREKIERLSGTYAFVIESNDLIFACVDKIRSIPIFYSKTIDGTLISNSANALREKKQLTTIDDQASLEFRMSGFVTGAKTLYSELFQLQGGELLIANKKKTQISTDRYFKYYPKRVSQLSEDELIQKHDEVLKRIFLKLIETLNGRLVWLPLSGGLDSRLILAKLLEYKYDNIKTFTYGKPQLWEVKVAREIAQKTCVEWEFIDYSNQKVKQLFHEKERGQYFEFASGLSSVPFINEYLILKYYNSIQTIPKSSIIINGQSGDFLTGGHIPEQFIDAVDKEIDFDLLVKLIIDKHFSLWKDLKNKKNIDLLKKQIWDEVKQYAHKKMTAEDAANVYEYHEWQERQCKFVVNGQRVYDWFGYDWRLPLWSDELIEFWRDVPYRVKAGQNLYVKYLKIFNPGNLFRLEFNYKLNYCPVFLTIPRLIYSLMVKLLKLNPEYFNTAVLKYYGAYSPFYPQKNFFEFFKDSKLHRNATSYQSRILLDQILNLKQQ